MKKNVFVIVIMLFCGYLNAQIKNQEFVNFTNLFIEIVKYPYNYKKDTPSPIYKNSQQHRIAFEFAKKYLGFSDRDCYAVEYEYNYDEDIRTERVVENPPLAHLKISSINYIGLVYRNSRGSENDTFRVVFNTFNQNGILIDKIVVGGQYTYENDWRDVVFLKNNILRIFDYKPNLENCNIKGGVYYTIDEKQPKTIVEITDYQIDENGKITLIKTHPKQYLKEWVAFYRSYQKDSDDPMNEY